MGPHQLIYFYPTPSAGNQTMFVNFAIYHVWIKHNKTKNKMVQDTRVMLKTQDYYGLMGYGIHAIAYFLMGSNGSMNPC